ncbi:GPO family capsid scaffolding protein [Yersinia pseudotuberculosis]|uniref:GPO family capsid scaffolding protein n=1 Tax=Yersinia pseudotuberculosis TaxID=633 RepID=UPI0001739800|nr:GPO family capsid scaffolding protein [Yersinia pseudotuberculosis]AJJ66801.1 phage capsid scaffolding (GPO) serine peptidase family protein [Yersinia pseudotuberculosis PB1/+]MBO1560476.1 phage capsid protein [Yersinia pseudotuberculosis]MCF1163252.1 GPO family capsid scaffolding protein [Yersinia pseudotuberculosis]
MPSSQLTTNFIRIATEGATVDGREIPAEWLVDMAESYDPAIYTAMIWPEHERWYGACGEVQELKAEVEDGLMRLKARLCPGMDLLYANRNGQMLFCSIEPTETLNFRGTGKPYLEGLGVTSSPASVGTERMRFSANKNGKLYGALEALVISDVADTEELNMSTKDSKTKKALFRSLFNIADKDSNKKPEKPKSRFFSNPSKKFSDEDVQAIVDAVAELQDVVDEQATIIIELQTNVTDVTEIQEALTEVQTELETVQVEVTEIKEEVTGGEFSKLKNKLNAADKKFNKLEQVTTKLPDAAPNASSGKSYNF